MFFEVYSMFFEVYSMFFEVYSMFFEVYSTFFEVYSMFPKIYSMFALFLPKDFLFSIQKFTKLSVVCLVKQCPTLTGGIPKHFNAAQLSRGFLRCPRRLRCSCAMHIPLRAPWRLGLLALLHCFRLYSIKSVCNCFPYKKTTDSSVVLIAKQCPTLTGAPPTTIGTSTQHS